MLRKTETRPHELLVYVMLFKHQQTPLCFKLFTENWVLYNTHKITYKHSLMLRSVLNYVVFYQSTSIPEFKIILQMPVMYGMKSQAHDVTKQ